MASASGSQTDNADSDSDLDREPLPDIIQWRSILANGGAFLTATAAASSAFVASGGVGAAAAPPTPTSASFARDAAAATADASPPLPSASAPFAGEQGRGEHVLVERRPTTASHSSHWTGYSLDPSSSSTVRPARRRLSPGLRATTSFPPSPSLPRSVSRGRRVTRHAAPADPRELSPEPLTLDSITSTFNPFPLVQRHLAFRTELLAEVLLLSAALAFAIVRLDSIDPSVLPVATSLPIPLFALLVALVPIIALFRSPDSYLKVPFTDERGYRSPLAADDGVAAALSLPLLLASACLWETYSSLHTVPLVVGLEGTRPLVDIWEHAGIHAVPGPALSPSPLETAHALLAARTQLVLLTALNAAVLILHLALAKTVLRIERLPKGNAKRFMGFNFVAWGVSAIVYASFSLWDWSVGLPISPLEAGLTTMIQQSSFYLVSRLARRGFTLGELNTMTSAGNALTLEFWRLSRSRWMYKRGHPMIPPTFRAPTALLVYQTVLIPGAFLSGFLLSPLLVISRHIAQKPSHRLKWPTERERHRRLLAAGVFLGLFGIVFFMLGGWVGWELGGGLRRPWLWALTFVLYGGDGVDDRLPSPSGWRRWKRLLLVAYWAGTIVVAVGGWQTRLVRARRIRISGSAPGEKTDGPGVRVEQAREEKRVHASLNMRRKFFHALAVMMFVPGIAIDPAFTSLGFSVAFAFFTFSEYARYFALYPVGAPLHIFFSEFVDNKDSGPVILSHFYLLSGCAGGLWLEGRGVNRFTGVLVLGVGDAMASIVGKLVGRNRWPGTIKTVEGSAAFVVSILFCAWLLRLTGLTSNFSMVRYTIATSLAALLEACSTQNDNLVIPIYMWSLVALLDCN